MQDTDENKKKRATLAARLLCGKGGIRTPGASQHGGFQDRCNRPLYHLSSASSRGLLLKSDAKVDSFFETCKWFDVFFVMKGKNTNFAPNKMRITIGERVFYQRIHMRNLIYR